MFGAYDDAAGTAQPTRNGVVAEVDVRDVGTVARGSVQHRQVPGAVIGDGVQNAQLAAGRTHQLGVPIRCWREEVAGEGAAAAGPLPSRLDQLQLDRAAFVRVHQHKVHNATGGG